MSNFRRPGATAAVAPTIPLDAISAAIDVLRRRADDAAPLNPEEAEAVATIYQSYASMLRRTVGRFVGAGWEAEDLVHDVILRLPSLIRQYGGRGFGGWLRRIATTTALMRLRRERHESLSECAEPMDTTSTEDLIACRDLVQRVLSQLADHQRQVVELKFFHEQSHSEIGEALGITATASEIRLCRALKQLRSIGWLVPASARQTQHTASSFSGRERRIRRGHAAPRAPGVSNLPSPSARVEGERAYASA
jgi:RNA polymerase sigma-70 factor, ECF subfamily